VSENRDFPQEIVWKTRKQHFLHVSMRGAHGLVRRGAWGNSHYYPMCMASCAGAHEAAPHARVQQFSTLFFRSSVLQCLWNFNLHILILYVMFSFPDLHDFSLKILKAS